MNLSGAASVYGIFGDPVSHSLSPMMQNLAIREAGLDAVYVPFHVPPDKLESAVGAIRSLNIGGVNVTIPHKQQVVSLLDHVDQDAALIGAVNTIVNRNGVLTGYNTDGLGFIRSLSDDLNFDPQGKTVLLFGAGGACRAAMVSLLHVGVKQLCIVNRNLQRAELLKNEMQAVFPDSDLVAYGLETTAWDEYLTHADLVVNTTSMGLGGEELSFCPLAKIKASASVYDMVYSTAETPFVRSARARGLAAADGLGMLAGQGEEAFTLWFDLSPTKGLMRDCLQRLRATNHS